MRTLAANLGKGIVAGVFGTAAMTVSSSLEAKIRDRGSSSTPTDAASKVLGIDSFTSDEAKSRFGQLVHWGYGTGWGAVRGVLATALPGALVTPAHLAAVWGSEQVMLPALEVSPAVITLGAKEAGIDFFHHLVYATATGMAYGWLDQS